MTDEDERDTGREQLLARNQAGKRLRDRLVAELSHPAPDSLWAEYNFLSEALHRTVVDLVPACRVGDTVETQDGPMIVAAKELTWDGRTRMVLTSDGLPREREWHEGPDSDNWIRAEVYSSDGLIFHGYVDSVSRKVVQTG